MLAFLAPVPFRLQQRFSESLLGNQFLVLLSVNVDNVLKMDLSDVWLIASSIEDIFLMEKKGGGCVRGFSLEGALTASGSHWDRVSFFVLYLHKPPQGAFGGEDGMRGWPPGLGGCDQTLPSHLCSGDLESPGPRETPLLKVAPGACGSESPL